MAGSDQTKGRGGRRRVAIIGAGFSGSVLAAQLMRQGRAAPEVILIERGRRFGPGLAYGTRDRAHLLNVRASNMSAFPDDADHFVRWLGRHARGSDASTFATRAQYGAYVEHVLVNAKAGLFGARVTRVRGSATAVRRDGERWSVSLRGGKEIAADAVVLACGHPPTSVPLALVAVPVLDPWDGARLARVHGDVLLLGTGLTMIDVALSLARAHPKRIIYALSRRGQLPRAHGPSHPAPIAAADLPPSLSEALHIMRRRAREDWRDAVEQLRPHTPAIWASWPPDLQRRFLRHARPWWDVHRHRAAPHIAEQLAALQQDGRLRVLAGDVVSAEASPRGLKIQHRQRGSHVRHRLDVAAIVNCTGADPDLRRWDDPLMRQLLSEGLAQPPANGMGLDVDENGGVVGAPPGLYALGPVTQGAFWESTAVPEIRMRAAQIANSLS